MENLGLICLLIVNLFSLYNIYLVIKDLEIKWYNQIEAVVILFIILGAIYGMYIMIELYLNL